MHSVFINLHFSDNSLQTNSSVNNVDSQIQNTIALEMFQMHFPTTYLALSAILDWLLSCHWSSKILAWLMDFVLIAWSQVTQILNRNPQILNICTLKYFCDTSTNVLKCTFQIFSQVSTLGVIASGGRRLLLDWWILRSLLIFNFWEDSSHLENTWTSKGTIIYLPISLGLCQMLTIL